jgi:nucleoside-diphosphate-sugar epimerase
MKVSIIGLGWFGLALAKELSKENIEIYGTTRTPEKLDELRLLGFITSLLEPNTSPDPDLFNTDYLIFNIPPREEHLSWIKSWPINKYQKIIFISSTSERQVLMEEENWVKSNFAHWLILRFAGLVGPKRHPGKFLAGRKELPGQNWPVNLLHLEDAVGFTKLALNLDLSLETINVLCDEKRSRKEFYSYFSQHLGLTPPEFNQNDNTLKPSIDNSRAKNLYQFKWPIISETSL